MQHPRGPFLGLSDPCHAPLGAYPYKLSIHFTGDCVDRCLGVTCPPGTGPCAATTSKPLNGLCESAPGTMCGSSNARICVQGDCIVEVSMSAGESGSSVCVAQGLTCDSVPACLAGLDCNISNSTQLESLYARCN